MNKNEQFEKLLNSSHSRAAWPKPKSLNRLMIFRFFNHFVTLWRLWRKNHTSEVFILSSKSNLKFISKKSMCMQYRSITHLWESIEFEWMGKNALPGWRLLDFTYLLCDFCVLCWWWLEGFPCCRSAVLSWTYNIIRKEAHASRLRLTRGERRRTSGLEQESEKHAPCSFLVRVISRCASIAKNTLLRAVCKEIRSPQTGQKLNNFLLL